MTKSIEIFTTPTCGFCKMTVEWIENNYDEEVLIHDVSEDSEQAQRMVDLSGQMGVPVTIFNFDGQEAQRIVIGFNEASLKDAFKDYLKDEVQEETFTNDFGFEQALEVLKAGGQVARRGWNGKGMFLFLVGGSEFKVNRAPLLGIYPEGTEITYRGHIDLRASDGTIGPWSASNSDLLQNDWFIVHEE